MNENNDRQLYCQEECPMAFRIEQLEQQTKEQEKNIKTIEITQAILERDIGSILQKVNEVSLDVKNIMNVPVKRYETIILGIITALIGAGIGYLIK